MGQSQCRAGRCPQCRQARQTAGRWRAGRGRRRWACASQMLEGPAGAPGWWGAGWHPDGVGSIQCGVGRGLPEEGPLSRSSVWPVPWYAYRGLGWPPGFWAGTGTGSEALQVRVCVPVAESGFTFDQEGQAGWWHEMEIWVRRAGPCVLAGGRHHSPAARGGCGGGPSACLSAHVWNREPAAVSASYRSAVARVMPVFSAESGSKGGASLISSQFRDKLMEPTRGLEGAGSGRWQCPPPGPGEGRRGRWREGAYKVGAGGPHGLVSGSRRLLLPSVPPPWQPFPAVRPVSQPGPWSPDTSRHFFSFLRLPGSHLSIFTLPESLKPGSK